MTGLRLSKIVAVGFRPAKYPSVNEVIINTIAIPVVNRVKKLPAPLLPKIVELEPPNTAPTSAPFPVCSNTTRINPMLTSTCTRVIAIIIDDYFLEKARTIDKKEFACKLAPPTNSPSTSSICPSIPAFSGLTLPP